MGELGQQIWKAKVTKEVIRLETQVKELQEKCQQPASKLLQVRDGPPPQIRDSTGRDNVLWAGKAGERQEREVEIICIGRN